jgi:hypothetical protein
LRIKADGVSMTLRPRLVVRGRRGEAPATTLVQRATRDGAA